MTAWLVKQEPSAYPFARLVADGTTRWDGVRNAQARIHLRAMKKGDLVLYYHSGDEKAIVGIVKVVKAPYPDPTDATGKWIAVDLAAVKPLPRAVTLVQIKAEASLQGMVLVKHSRLSVMPITGAELAQILEMSA